MDENNMDDFEACFDSFSSSCDPMHMEENNMDDYKACFDSLSSAYDQLTWELEDIEARYDSLQSPDSWLSKKVDDIEARYGSLQSAYDQLDMDENNMDDIEADDTDSLQPAFSGVSQDNKTSSGSTLKYKNRSRTGEVDFNKKVSQDKKTSSGSTLKYKNRSWNDETDFKKKRRRMKSIMDDIKARYERRQSSLRKVSQDKKTSSESTLKYKNKSRTDEVDFKKKRRREENNKKDGGSRVDSLQFEFSLVFQDNKTSSGSNLKYKNKSRTDEVDFKKKLLRKLEDIEACNERFLLAFSGVRKEVDDIKKQLSAFSGNHGTLHPGQDED